MATPAEIQASVREAINSLVTGKIKSYRIGTVSYERADLQQLLELDKHYTAQIKNAASMEERVCEF